MAKDKEKKKSRGESWDDVQPVTEGRRFDADIETFNFSEETHTQIRLIGPVFPVKIHWVPTLKKDGSRTSFPKLCLHNEDDAHSCPYCNAGIGVSTRYMTNAIIRDIEEARPRKAKWDKEAEFKKKGDSNWTPVRVVSFPASVMQKILNFKSLTKIKTKDGIKTFHVSHPKYGRDLNIKLDPSGTGSGMYDVQREAVSKLEGDELEYLLFDIDSVYEALESEQDAIETLRSCFERGVFEGVKDRNGKAAVNLAALQEMLGVKSKKRRRDDEDEDTPEDDEDTPRSTKKSKSGKKRRQEDDEDDVEIEEDEDFEEDDEEEAPRKKKSSKKKTKDDEDDDDDLEDDDLDEDDDDDLDEDDDENEEEEEAPRKKKKSSKSSKKKSKDEDEDDDDVIEDDEEDEEEEAPRKKSSKKKSKDEDDDEDDLDIEEDEDEDDDEEEAPRKKKKSSKRK